LSLLAVTLALTSCNVGNRRTENTGVDSVRKFVLKELWRTDTILLTPESVIYDRVRDILYVSNMNMEPRMKDANGFISKVDKEGKITELRWIEGMSSPKGLAIHGNILYAADVDEVVVMDIDKGEVIQKIPVPGSRMLNDIAVDGDGTLYISDTDANKIYRYAGGSVTEWLAEGLLGPNGLLLRGDSLFVASQVANNFAYIDVREKTMKVLNDSITHADGIAYAGIPGYYFVTDWDGEIFMINPDFSRTSLLRTKEIQINTADIEFIPELDLLLVPTFFRNSVIAYRLLDVTGQN
jgi:hypothetical protein